MFQDHRATDVQQSYIECDGLNLTRSETDWQFNCIVDNSISGSIKSQSGIGVMLRVQSYCLETNVASMKQCAELESTSVAMVTEGIRSDVSCKVKGFGLERVDALRHSSTEAPMRLMQPWSSARAEGLLPFF